MQLVKFQVDGKIRAGILSNDTIHYTATESATPIQDFLEADDFSQALADGMEQAKERSPVGEVQLLAPLDLQEVWAAGVTYTRSKSARMEESEAAASCYDRVYQSDRPELFLKATPHRVVGPNGPLRIRSDSKWNVPEPEVTLVINSRQEFVGMTIGNDMSSRDIEGDNPLYLPQAKVYDQCCGLGPGISPLDPNLNKSEMTIQLRIDRGGEEVFTSQTDAGQMARDFEELLGWLCRDNSFPNGAFLLTGTGIVPDSDFTLQPGDTISISIAGLGTLTNSVIQG